MAEPILAKTLLAPVKNDPWFGLSYNMNLYRGCQHGCIYCDSRSSCYQLGELTHIRFKKNAIELLTAELPRKRKKGTIGTGSMNDPYMPVEKELRLTRSAMEIIERHKFPVHIITKSTLVERDMDVLQSIGAVYSAVSVTITAANDGLSKTIEPGAPVTSDRFNTIEKLSKAGIYCGVTMMPVLPFINDTTENLELMMLRAKEAGAQYVMSFFGMTLRDGCREYYYEKLDDHFPGLKAKYGATYANRYECYSPIARRLFESYFELADKYGLKTKMDFYVPPAEGQLKLF
jgi:DNA repair photolyase